MAGALSFHSHVAVLGASPAAESSVLGVGEYRLEDPTEVGSHQRLELVLFAILPENVTKNRRHDSLVSMVNDSTQL